MGLLEDKEVYYDIRDLGYFSLLQIEGVTSKSPAKKAGIKKGDVVVSFDGTKITGAPDIIEILWKKDPGDVVDVEVYRDKKIIKLELKLGTYKEKK
jgi:serine protease Do